MGDLSKRDVSISVGMTRDGSGWVWIGHDDSGGSEEPELFLRDAEGFLADPRSLLRVLSGRSSGAVILLVLVLFAFDLALGELDHAGDKAGEFVRIGQEAFAEGFRVEVHEEITDVGGEDLEDGLGDLGAVFGEEEVLERVAFGAQEFTFLLLVQPLVVAAAGAPGAEVVLGDTLDFGREAAEDVEVGNAVLEHFADFVAGGFWQAGDFAVAAFRVREGEGMGERLTGRPGSRRVSP
jgi:hypothetical protein